MRILVASLLLAGLAAVPTASAAPCDGQVRLEADCYFDHVQGYPDAAIDQAENATGQDAGAVQAFFNTVYDKLQGRVQWFFDQPIPCVNTSGPACF